MDLTIDLNRYRLTQPATVHLDHWPTSIPPLSESKKHYETLLEQYRNEISERQSVLYAHNRYALLLIFQGMDTSGKGGAIKHVMSGVNPQGCQVYSFGPPSDEELDHDFLWRSNRCLPERGRIGIFDRSYYEEVLIVRVRPDILARQRIPAEHLHPETLWLHRYLDINALEAYLHRNGTRILKFFLHLSPDEQRKRLLARIDDPAKNWKFNLHDLDARDQWNDYQQAFSQCLEHTATPHAPWHIIPADDKRNARLLVSKILVDTLNSLDIAYPTLSTEQRENLQRARQRLT